MLLNALGFWTEQRFQVTGCNRNGQNRVRPKPLDTQCTLRVDIRKSFEMRIYHRWAYLNLRVLSECLASKIHRHFTNCVTDFLIQKTFIERSTESHSLKYQYDSIYPILVVATVELYSS